MLLREAKVDERQLRGPDEWIPLAAVARLWHVRSDVAYNPKLVACHLGAEATLQLAFGPMAELRGIHVLVIDDDQLARHFLRSVLEFIACDLASAEAAGGEFLSQLQPLHVRLGRTVPAIALVPAGARSTRVRATGFQMHLMKPVDGDELRAAVLEMARR